MKQKSTRLAWQISLAYCAAAGLWILLSDWVVTAFIPEPRQINSLQTMKGLAFVGVTTVLLYGILRRAFRRWLEEAVARQRADESLSASEAKLRAIFDAEPNCIKLLDGDAGLVEINRAGLEIVEAETHSEVVGKCLLPLVSVEQREAVRHMIANARGGQPGRMEFEIRALKGSLRWLEMTVTPIRDPRNGCDLVLAVSHDITARKNTELELRRSEERIRLLIENASDLITVVNGKGIIRFQSPSGERVLGYKPSDMVGRSALELVHPEDQPKVGDAIRRALSDPSTPVAEEFRFRHANGSWRVMQAVGKAVADEASEGFLIVNSRDVTDSKTLEEQLRQAQKMEGIGQLAGGVAHDFNNILAVIQMNAGLLETGGELSAAQHEHVVEIGKAAQRAANLTRQLLLFSRRQTMQPRDLDLNEVVLNIAKMLQRMLGEDIQMQFKLAPQPLYVRADQGMMDQVLMNLAVNSRDAMPRGGTLLVETAIVLFDESTASQFPQGRPGLFACLRVSDTGTGIAPEVLPHVFEPFFTTKDVGKGTGLGLPTVLGIVQQHGGWVDVYSEQGRGTTFRIYMPRLDSVADDKTKTGMLTSIRGGSETILLVEDDSIVRRLMAKILNRLGYSVVEASTGSSAIEAWRQHDGHIQLLLTDVVMPEGMGGRDLAQRLLEFKPGLKVIYMSGYSLEIAAGDFPLTEGVNFLAKPCEAHKLAQIVRHRLDHE